MVLLAGVWCGACATRRKPLTKVCAAGESAGCDREHKCARMECCSEWQRKGSQGRLWAVEMRLGSQPEAVIGVTEWRVLRRVGSLESRPRAGERIDDGKC